MITGSIVAIITPLDAQLNVNYEKLTELLEWHIAHKTDGIVILGTTGEASTLTKDEKLRVFKHTVSVVNKRIPVIAGTGSNNTVETMLFSKEVEKLGVDGLLIVTPYYNKSNVQGYVEHYKTIAMNVSLPIIVYNVPSRTGVQLPLEAIKHISNIPNIIGIKEASGDLSYASLIQANTREDFILYSGNDDIVIPMLAIGASGVISVAANVIPEVMHDIVEFYLEGNTKQALELQLLYLPLINSLFLETNPIPVKEALNLLGFEVGGFRLPLYPMSDEAKAKMQTILQGYFQ